MHAHEKPFEEFPSCGHGAVNAGLEPFRGHLKPKLVISMAFIDKIFKKLLLIKVRRAWRGFAGWAWLISNKKLSSLCHRPRTST